MDIFHNDWDDILEEEMEKPYYQELRRLLVEEYRHHPIYPKPKDVFNALQRTSFQDTKVVILGQDPYHGKDQAHGLAFSVESHTPMPPSLRNIFQELYNDLGIRRTKTNLTDWAEQGVLLLNTTLTVREHNPLSHGKIGWELFTDHIISLIGEKEEPVVFLLWGNHAREKRKLIKKPHHLVIESVHPSPLSANRGFFGSKPFSRTNDFLMGTGRTPINW